MTKGTLQSCHTLPNAQTCSKGFSPEFHRKREVVCRGESEQRSCFSLATSTRQLMGYRSDVAKKMCRKHKICLRDAGSRGHPLDTGPTALPLSLGHGSVPLWELSLVYAKITFQNNVLLARARASSIQRMEPASISYFPVTPRRSGCSRVGYESCFVGAS
jgi:hypothetical protein